VFLAHNRSEINNAGIVSLKTTKVRRFDDCRIGEKVKIIRVMAFKGYICVMLDPEQNFQKKKKNSTLPSLFFIHAESEWTGCWRHHQRLDQGRDVSLACDGQAIVEAMFQEEHDCLTVRWLVPTFWRDAYLQCLLHLN
jgi:hypothetical protein